jgi:hypothetical protein
MHSRCKYFSRVLFRGLFNEKVDSFPEPAGGDAAFDLDHRRSPGRRFPVSQRAILNAGFTPYGGRLPAY